MDKLNNPAVQINIIYKGKPRAVLINADEIDARRETLEILSDKKLMKQINEAEKDFKKGGYHTFEEVFGCTPRQALSAKK